MLQLETTGNARYLEVAEERRQKAKDRELAGVGRLRLVLDAETNLVSALVERLSLD